MDGEIAWLFVIVVTELLGVAILLGFLSRIRAFIARHFKRGTK